MNTWALEHDPSGAQSAPLDIYITSFCEEPDLLSQWRAYGSAEGRYCIGFEVRELQGLDVPFPLSVAYEVADQTRLLSQTVDTILGATRFTLENKHIPADLAELVSIPPKKYADDREVLDDARFALTVALDRVLCRLKHRAFKEEREWRSVVDASHYEQREIVRFDVAGGAVRPYVERLRRSRSDPERLPIREIYVGHSRRPAQAKRTVELLLRHFGYRNCDVKVADVPLVE